VRTFKKRKASALGHPATSPILRMLCSPNVGEKVKFYEVRGSKLGRFPGGLRHRTGGKRTLGRS
jgi:hypothetical protein